MLERLPPEILASEICSKLTLIDIVQVGIALNLGFSGIYNPERIYPRDEWIDNGYDEKFYETLMDCMNKRRTLSDEFYKTEEVIEKAYSVLNQIVFKKDSRTFDILKKDFEIEKLVSLNFLNLDTRLPILQT